MPEKYRIIAADKTAGKIMYYVSRETDAGRITWTEAAVKATTFASRSGAENVLRILEEMNRAARVYSVSMTVEVVESHGAAPEKKAREAPPPAPKENEPPDSGKGEPRAVFRFGKLPPLRLYINKKDGGFEYFFEDENGKIRASGTGAAEGRDVATMFCVYARDLMCGRIEEAEKRHDPV